MTVYPIVLRSRSFDHVGGSKSYHLHMFTNEKGDTVFVRRWGKKGAFGQLKVELYRDVSDGLKAWDKMERSKSEYRPVAPMRTEKANDAAELRSKMGLSLYTKIGRDAINFLDPDIDTSGMRELDPPRVGEDGKLTGLDKPRTVDLTEEIEATKRLEEAKARETLAKLPNFGRF